MREVEEAVGKRPRTRITAAEVEAKLQQLREDFQGALTGYHENTLVPYITSVVRAIMPRVPWWRRIQMWLRIRLANYRLNRRIKRYQGKDVSRSLDATVPLVTAMRLKPSQRLHLAHKGYTRALCGEQVDHNKPVNESLRLCLNCRRLRRKMEREAENA